MTDITEEQLLAKFRDLSEKQNLQDEPGIGAVVTLVEWFRETHDISTVQEFIKEMGEKSNMLARNMRFLEIKSACNIYMRHLTRHPEQLEVAEDFAACKQILMARSDLIVTYLKNATKTAASYFQELVPRRGAVFTYGYSTMVRDLLILARVKRGDFTVVVSRGGPFGHGERMVKDLQSKNIKALLVEDVAAYFYMDKYQVKAVFLSAEAIFTNGATVCKIGTGNCVALAKQRGLKAHIFIECYKYQEDYVYYDNRDVPDKVLYPMNASTDELQLPHAEFLRLRDNMFFCSDLKNVSVPHLLELLHGLYK